MNMPASVTMNAGISSAWISAPMHSPNAVVSASSRAKTASGCSPVSRSMTAMNTPENAITDPMLRSIPPDRMTMVMPTAAMPR